MKQLHFKKWVKNLLTINAFIAFMMLCIVEFNSLLVEVVFGLTCISLILVNSILLTIFE